MSTQGRASDTAVSDAPRVYPSTMLSICPISMLVAEWVIRRGRAPARATTPNARRVTEATQRA